MANSKIIHHNLCDILSGRPQRFLRRGFASLVYQRCDTKQVAITMKFIKKTVQKGLNEIVDLVNAAYRGTGGEKRWTTEAHFGAGRPAGHRGSGEIATGSAEFYLSFIEES